MSIIIRWLARSSCSYFDSVALANNVVVINSYAIVAGFFFLFCNLYYVRRLVFGDKERAHLAHDDGGLAASTYNVAARAPGTGTYLMRLLGSAR